jgi:quinol monooxygenase YgiN
VGRPEDRIGVERGWIGSRFRVLVCTDTGSDKITSSGTRQQERHELEQEVWVSVAGSSEGECDGSIRHGGQTGGPARTGPRAPRAAHRRDEGVAGADGCELYVVGQDRDDLDRIWVLEAWRDEAAHRASLDLPAVRGVIERGLPLTTERDGAKLEPVGGLGLD